MKHLLIPTVGAALALLCFSTAAPSPAAAGEDVLVTGSVASEAADVRTARKLARPTLTCAVTEAANAAVTEAANAQIVKLDYYVDFVWRKCAWLCFEIGGEDCPCTIYYFF